MMSTTTTMRTKPGFETRRSRHHPSGETVGPRIGKVWDEADFETRALFKENGTERTGKKIEKPKNQNNSMMQYNRRRGGVTRYSGLEHAQRKEAQVLKIIQ